MGDVDRLTQVTHQGYARAESLKLADDDDDFMMGVGEYWNTYFGSDKERFYKDKELQDVVAKFTAHEFSVQSLSADLLQFAKQGMSIVHSGLKTSPPGRSIGTQALRDVIWQGRNQALHWEAHNFTPAVVNCFQRLAQDVDPKFSYYNSRSMAFDVVELLGWGDFAHFRTDMLLLS